MDWERDLHAIHRHISYIHSSLATCLGLAWLWPQAVHPTASNCIPLHPTQVEEEYDEGQSDDSLLGEEREDGEGGSEVSEDSLEDAESLGSSLEEDWLDFGSGTLGQARQGA